MSFRRRDIGIALTNAYKAYVEGPNGVISAWHDIPLLPAGKNLQDRVVNMVVEIPRWTNAKMEISKKDAFNPIVQDVKKGALRFVDNVFPFKGYIWNYGAIPQTWEDPNVADPHTGEKGDDDPLDILEIGQKVLNRGDVVQVKVLGVLAMIDEGETDWKIIAINVDDPLASKVNGPEDIDKLLPGLSKATHDWFKFYKVPAGKPENNFAFEGKIQSVEMTLKVIQETHAAWKKLVENDAPKYSLMNSLLKNKLTVDASQHVPNEVNNAGDSAASVKEPDSVQKWHFINKNY